MSPEPSVLDYLKSRVAPWRRWLSGAQAEQPRQESYALNPRAAADGPWLAFSALGLALAAQVSLEPGRERTWLLGSLLYALAAVALGWASAKGRREHADAPAEEPGGGPLTARRFHLALAAILGLLAFISFGDNRFSPWNVSLWFLAIAACVVGLWSRKGGVGAWWQRLRSLATSAGLTISFSRWTVAVLGAWALCVLFRAYRLWDVPPEMTSDHAEHLLSVADLLDGKASIYFTRYPGREGLLIYLTALASAALGTGLSFMSLKIVTMLCGVLTLPYVYLIGKEMWSRSAGLWAMTLTGLAYWPNVLSRTGQQFTLCPLFVAATLFHLLRGLRRGSVNDFILTGVFLGLGLHGYGSFRVTPALVILAVLMYVLHARSVQKRRDAMAGLGAAALCALVVFLPLLRFALSSPGVFFSRAVTHLFGHGASQAVPSWQTFFGNLWRALTTCAWDNGEVWVFSVPHRPALDVVSGALFHLGVVLLVARYLFRRRWFDLFIPVSIPVLMLPSVLSLAFPSENPSLALSAGALVPIFLIAGCALDWLMQTAQSGIGGRLGRVVSFTLLALLLTGAGLQNFMLVFGRYADSYRAASWNASELGRTVRAFAESVGTVDSAWVVGYPHWVDTRLVGFEAGYPGRDFLVSQEGLRGTVADARIKVFLLKADDAASVELLYKLYPDGRLSVRRSETATKDFLLFLAPPRKPSP